MLAYYKLFQETVYEPLLFIDPDYEPFHKEYPDFRVEYTTEKVKAPDMLFIYNLSPDDSRIVRSFRKANPAMKVIFVYHEPWYGIKGWLCDNLPEIYEKYTTAMRYKAAAKKLKQVVELADPTPADVVLPHGAAERKDGSKRDYGADEVEGRRADGAGDAAEGRGEAEVPELAVVRARAIWGEIVEGIGQSATALMMRLDALTDPGRVEDANMLAAWREKYANEITERTKKRWWRRLVEKSRPGKARKRAA